MKLLSVITEPHSFRRSRVTPKIVCDACRLTPRVFLLVEGEDVFGVLPDSECGTREFT
jgi:hypothetical protein